MTQVTIVIPNYNGIKFLKACMDALRGQVDAPAFEVLVVDNGSTDGSVEYLESTYPQVRLLKLATNTGFCHAVNEGIRQSQSPYVLLLNNDTKADPSFVKYLYEAISAPTAKKVFSVSACMVMWQDETKVDGAGDYYTVLGWSLARGKGQNVEKYDRCVRIFSACGGAAIYKREVLDQIGLFDEAHFAYLEDLDLGYRAKSAGYENLYEPKARVIHYGSATSGSRYNAWKIELAAANSVYVIVKNMPFLQWLFNTPFLLLGKLVKWVFFCRKGYGRAYAKGIWKGIVKSFCKQGRKQIVWFSPRRMGHYFRIQVELFWNVFRILMKS